ncbi:MAG: hypothetical protein PHQ59_01785 [Candidatus Daviesbacteria bacterium]|nr:hypothetical protein [Candidatus Daviesbacteria bacterium]
MPNFLDTLKTNILSPIEKGVSSVGKTLGDFFKPVSTKATDLFKPIAELTKQSEYAIPGDKGGSYKPYENLWVETAAQTFGIGARESGFWERLPSATVGALGGAGTGLAKAFTFGWWNPEIKYADDTAAMAAKMTDVEFNILGTVATFLVGGELIQGAARGIPAVARFARIAPKTYSLLTNGLTFAGLGQVQKSEFYKDASQRAKDFGADFALGGAFSIAGMKPSYFKSTGIIAPAAYVTSLIKGDSPEDALKNTAAVIALHSTNYALAKAFPSQAAQLEKNMEKAASEQLSITKKQAFDYLGVNEKASADQIKTAWKQKVVDITKQFPAQSMQTPQEMGQFNQAWNTANRAYEFLTKIQNPTGYTGKTFRQEFEDLFRELWVNVPDKRALVVSTIRNMPAGLSVRSTLTDEQRAEVIKGLGGEEVKTKFGLPANKLSNSDLITLAKEQNIKVTPSKGTPEMAIAEAVKTPEAAPSATLKETPAATEQTPAIAEEVAITNPTWKDGKALWNTLRNQYGQTNKYARDMTVNKGVVNWVIDNLKNGVNSKLNLMEEAKKFQGQKITNDQYKDIYAMFKGKSYDIEGYKKVMSTIKAATAPAPAKPTEGFQFDADSTDKVGKVAVKDAGLFDKGSIFRQKGKTAGVSYLMGKNTQTGNIEPQAVYFDKKVIPETEAAKWWTKNGDRFTKPWVKPAEVKAPEPKPAPAPVPETKVTPPKVEKQPGEVSPQVKQLQLKKDALEKLRYSNPGDDKIVRAIKKIDDQIAQQFTAQEQKAAKAEEIRLKYRPEEKELLDAERVPSVGEIMKDKEAYLKKFQERMQGKVKAPKKMRADEMATPPKGSAPRPPKEEPITQAPPPPEGSALEQIDKMVGKLGKAASVADWLKGVKPWFSRNFTDRYAPMKQFEETVSKLQGLPIDIDSSPYIAARLYAGRFGTIEVAFRDLQKIVSPVRKFRPDFTRYVLAQRAIERADRGFDNPAGVTKETGEKALTELKEKVGEKVYKQFEQAGQAIQNWSIRNILEPMRDTGLISKKAFNAVVEKNKSWMPFHVLDYLPDAKQADQMQAGSETFSVSKQGVIQGLKGTEKQIRDPFESIVDNLSKAINLTKRNEVARKLIDLRKSHPEAKEFIKYLYKDAKAPKDWDTISAFINGKVTRWAVPKELSEAMHALSPAEAGVMGKLAMASTRAFKAGVTTFYIPFTLTNAIRDFQTASIVTKWGFSPVNWLSGLMDGFKGAFKWESKAYDDFLKNQGGYGGYIGNAKQLSVVSKELFTPSWWTKTKAIINPFQLISNFSEAVELAPRLGIYKKGIAKPGVTTTEAAFEARNATVDFAKAGKEMRIINQWIPFVNARWQGLLRVKDAFKENPLKSALKAMALIVMPGVATYFYNIMNHEDLWDDIPQWAKDQYFIIILGSEKDKEGKTVPKVLQIPKGDMGAIFYNPLEYAFEYVRKQEPANLLKLAVEWTSQLSPVPFSRDGELSGSAFLGGALPPALKTLVEEVTNLNLFTGFPIIPRKLEKVAPTEQYNEKTEPLAVMLGRAVGWSPMRIAHIATGLFGSSSKYVFNPSDLVGASLQRFVRTQGGAKENAAWQLLDDTTVGYNTARIQVQKALTAGNLPQAQKIATDWNNKAKLIVPQITPLLFADDPKEAVSFQKSVMFDASDMQRLLKLSAPAGTKNPVLKPGGSAPRANDPLGLMGGSAPAPSAKPTMGQMFPTGGGATKGNDPLGLFK